MQVHPKLHQTIQVIFAQRVKLPSKKEELLGNFKLSVRGSIRKGPNVMSGPQSAQIVVNVLLILFVFI